MTRRGSERTRRGGMVSNLHNYGRRALGVAGNRKSREAKRGKRRRKGINENPSAGRENQSGQRNVEEREGGRNGRMECEARRGEAR